MLVAMNDLTTAGFTLLRVFSAGKETFFNLKKNPCLQRLSKIFRLSYAIWMPRTSRGVFSLFNAKQEVIVIRIDKQCPLTGLQVSNLKMQVIWNGFCIPDASRFWPAPSGGLRKKKETEKKLWNFGNVAYLPTLFIGFEARIRQISSFRRVT